MEVMFVILIGFMVVNFVADIIYINTKNKYIKVMETQNTLLWAVVNEAKEMVALSIKEIEKVKVKTEDIKVTIDGNELNKVLKEAVEKDKKLKGVNTL